MSSHPPEKKKYKPFRHGQIVRHSFHFGHVMDIRNGVTVRFPDPHESDSYKDINFHPDGTLLGKGERILFHADQPAGLDEVCREMSRRLEDADKRIKEDKKPSLFAANIIEEEDTDF
jgi:hypothetical protein